ncbi:type II toxin-antitoxin system RelE/ParE family toxin [Aerosakkonema funiforme]|uniref:type II toxin-antitoxin system RelE/ParE family toxin n=1 Tax=Aerosakkonema funiforme TaxID=1246630 RepID=UPI0035B7F668
MTQNQNFISSEALADLDEIFDYFAGTSVEAGEKFASEFKKNCQYLTQFPNLGRSYAELKPNLRGIPLMGYIIFYQVVETGVEIVRVVSAYRDLKSLF